METETNIKSLKYLMEFGGYFTTDIAVIASALARKNYLRMLRMRIMTPIS